MFRKSMIALAATAALSTTALVSADAFAKPNGGGWGKGGGMGGWHHGYHGARPLRLLRPRRFRARLLSGPDPPRLPEDHLQLLIRRFADAAPPVPWR